jgi:hypothetical protein
MNLKDLFGRNSSEEEGIDLIAGMDFDDFIHDALHRQEGVEIPEIAKSFTEVLEETRLDVEATCRQEMKNFIDVYGTGKQVDIARNIDILVRRLHIICFQTYRTARKEYLSYAYNEYVGPYSKLRETFIGPRIETRRLLGRYKTDFAQFKNLVAHLYEGDADELLSDREAFFEQAVSKLKEVLQLPANLQEVRG